MALTSLRRGAVQATGSKRLGILRGGLGMKTGNLGGRDRLSGTQEVRPKALALSSRGGNPYSVLCV